MTTASVDQDQVRNALFVGCSPVVKGLGSRQLLSRDRERTLIELSDPVITLDDCFNGVSTTLHIVHTFQVLFTLCHFFKLRGEQSVAKTIKCRS